MSAVDWIARARELVESGGKGTVRTDETPSEPGANPLSSVSSVGVGPVSANEAHAIGACVGGDSHLDRPFRLSEDDADRCHAEPWTDEQCRAFAWRVSKFIRIGIEPADADDIAERLHLRDVDQDDRRSCLECTQLSGHASTSWRCRSAAAACVAPTLPPVLVTRLQRCPGFEEGANG